MKLAYRYNPRQKKHYEMICCVVCIWLNSISFKYRFNSGSLTEARVTKRKVAVSSDCPDHSSDVQGLSRLQQRCPVTVQVTVTMSNDCPGHSSDVRWLSRSQQRCPGHSNDVQVTVAMSSDCPCHSSDVRWLPRSHGPRTKVICKEGQNLTIILPSTGPENNIVQPKTAQWLSFPSNVLIVFHRLTLV